MIVRFERPPLFDKIHAKFDVAGKPIIFAFGQVIYNPERIKIPSTLFAHEKVHGERQGKQFSDIENWWLRYIEDKEFRFTEELLAHRAEYHAYRKLHGPGQRTAKYLDQVAEKLSSPLYGGLVTPKTARHWILCQDSFFVSSEGPSTQVAGFFAALQA